MDKIDKKIQRAFASSAVTKQFLDFAKLLRKAKSSTEAAKMLQQAAVNITRGLSDEVGDRLAPYLADSPKFKKAVKTGKKI